MMVSNYEALTQQLYISYFGRPADYYGLASFESQLAAAGAPGDFASLSASIQAGNNPALNSLIDSFASSVESTALYGTGNDAISISKFVNAVYNNVLGRDADLTGLSFWVTAITSGTLNRADAAMAITEGALSNTSDQGKIDAAVVNNKLAVATSFTQALSTTSQINGYAGDIAAAMVRAMLAMVTDSTDPGDFQANIGATITAITEGNGISATLTVGEDHLTGSGTDDIYLAPIVFSSDTGRSADTLTSLDQIDGGGGINTLKATILGHEAPTLNNIENLQIRFAASAAELDLSHAVGVTSVLVLDSGSNSGTVANVGAAATLGVSGQFPNVEFTNSTAKTLTVTMDNYGPTVSSTVILTNDVATTVNVHIDSSSGAIEATIAIETLNVIASGSNELDVLDSSAIAAVTVGGSGSLILDETLSAVANLDASGNAGGVTVELGSTALKVLGGSGADAITLDGVVAGANVNLGAGDDVLTIKGAVNANAVIDGGAGANTLHINDSSDLAGFTSAATFKAGILDFQTLELSGTVSIDTIVIAGFNSYLVDSGVAQLHNLGAATALTIDGAVSGLRLSTDAALVPDISKAAVTLTLDNGGGSAIDGVSVGVLTTDTATLTVHSNGLVGATGDANAVTLDGVDSNLSKIVIDGSQAIDFSTGGSTGQEMSIDASAATGVLTIDASGATGVVNINGGSAGDTLLASPVGGTIYGGAGGDAISLGVGAVTIAYKAASDSMYSVTADGVTSGGGLDTITGFVSGTDKIDLTGLGLTPTSVIVDKAAASLNALTILATGANFYNDSAGVARTVVEVVDNGDSYLFIDANKDHKFNASTDLVIKLAGVTSIVAADLVFD